MRRAVFSSTLAAILLSSAHAAAAPTVWAIDDGEKLRRDAIDTPFETGRDNPIWVPGSAIKLVAVRNETVAFQIVVEADTAALDGVTVDLAELVGPGGAIKNEPGATDITRPAGRRIERFVEHFVEIKRVSGNTTKPTESLGWRAGSGPDPSRWVGFVPDALIPVEVAPAWSPYPMRVAPKQNGIVWVDVTVPRGQAPGVYRGDVVVKSSAGPLATLPVELTVHPVVLPDAPAKTMLYYELDSLASRMGNGPAAETNLWKLLHRHGLSAMHQALSAADLPRKLPALDGSLYTPANGYDGPGEGQGDGVLSLGTYGDYGAPTAARLTQVEGVATALAQARLIGKLDVFVYAADESCASPYGQGWVSLLASSKNADAKNIPVAWTCYQNPVAQPVHIPILPGQSYDAKAAQAAKAAGKRVWAYNGVRPHTGTFMIDTEAVSLRVNAWLQGMFDIERWYYWETVYWYDGVNGGQGPVDPFVTAENFHNRDGDYCNGDGMLLYPGKQVDRFTSHSIGTDALIASIRLKNLRRGVQDAGYMQLARAADPARVDSIVRKAIPKALSESSSGQPAWGERGKPFHDARMELLGVVTGSPPGTGPGPVSPDADGGTGPGAAPTGPGAGAAGEAAAGGCGCRSTSRAGDSAGGVAALGLGLGVLVLAGRRRRGSR